MVMMAPRTAVGRHETLVQSIPTGHRKRSQTAIATIQTTDRRKKLAMTPLPSRSPSLARQRREGLVEHLVRAQLRREDALHHEPLDERMHHTHEHIGRHRQFTGVERAQPLGAELVAAFRDLVYARP